MKSSDKILVAITGRTIEEVMNKILEIHYLNVKRAALFVTFFKYKSDRLKIYELLLSSKLRDIPFVHIRDEVDKDELDFLAKNFKTKVFNIHETSFRSLPKLRGYYKRIYLELNYDNHVPKFVDINKIGGFCIDFSHFKASQERFTKDFLYVLKNKDKKFVCNHLNGYDSKNKRDKHTIDSLMDFDYLETLPKFLFGRYIALEMFNSIEEQLEFKKYLVKFLSGKI